MKKLRSNASTRQSRVGRVGFASLRRADALPLLLLAPLALAPQCRPTGCGYPELSPSKCLGEGGKISDGEQGQSAEVTAHSVAGRGGYWFSYSESEAVELWPSSILYGGAFEMSPGGAEDTLYAARIHGSFPRLEKSLVAGMGLNFLEPKLAYDVSRYDGVAFWAKVGPNSISQVRLRIPDKNTNPDAGVCRECLNDFGIDLYLTEEWQSFQIPFAKLSQWPGWGIPRKKRLEVTQVYGLLFEVIGKDEPFDLWVDQIRFTGCKRR